MTKFSVLKVDCTFIAQLDAIHSDAPLINALSNLNNYMRIGEK